MNQFEQAKKHGLNDNQINTLNRIRGCVIASFLTMDGKKEISDFMTELEDYFSSDEGGNEDDA